MAEREVPDQEFFKPQNAEYDNRFTDAYSDSNFREKVQSSALSAGREVIERALQLSQILNTSELPRWGQVMVLTALGYFILPGDAIPDALPLVGYADDLGILVAAADCVSTFTTVEIDATVKEKLSQWFPADTTGEDS